MRQPKIAMIGAGASKFVRQTVVDLLQFEELRGATLCLMDVNPERLAVTERLIRRLTEGRAELRIESTTDQRRAVEGADFVLLTFMVGGRRQYASDTVIPERHGLSIACGDTTGPAAVFRLLRSARPLADLARNLRETAPDAWVISYANPMAMIVGLLKELGCSRVVGLCHSWRYALGYLGAWLDVPPDEIEFELGGLNHVDFFLRLEHRGRNLYPDLLANADRIVAEAEAWEVEHCRHERFGYERARMELVRYLGYFPLEGPWHQTEYYPWFRKNPDLVRHYGPASGWSLRFDTKLDELVADEVEGILSGRLPVPTAPSIEQGAPILHSLRTGTARRVVVNVANHEGWIPNLPRDAVVEVRGTVGADGLVPERIGPLPTQLLGVMLPHHIGHRLAIEAVLHKDRQRLRQAVQADPLTSAVLTLPQIAALVDDFCDANRDYLEDWT